ncbi:MAG: protein-export chaperone SecB [Alphaproteobacteria bacterium]
MSDSEKPDAGTGAEARKTKPTVRPVKILSQYTKDLSFENKLPAGRTLAPTAQADLKAKIDVTATLLGEHRFEVCLHIEAEATSSGQPIYLVELVYAAAVELTDVPEDQVEPLLFIEVPRFIFPFVRSMVATVTRDGGFPGMMSETVDFVEMYKRRLIARQKQQQAASATTDAPPTTH